MKAHKLCGFIAIDKRKRILDLAFKKYFKRWCCGKKCQTNFSNSILAQEQTNLEDLYA